MRHKQGARFIEGLSAILFCALGLSALIFAAPRGVDSFKVTGVPSAPMEVELFSDYQCDACRKFHVEVLPKFMADYVATGKARVVIRDFPLPSHRWSQTAALFADAAGLIGKFNPVAAQLYRQQEDWSPTGNVESAISAVVSPAELLKIRELVKQDNDLADSIATDKKEGNLRGVVVTPTLIVTFRSRRSRIVGVVAYPILKSFIDQILAGDQ